MRWTRADISFELLVDETDHPVVTFDIATPLGMLRLMGEVTVDTDAGLVLSGCHIEGPGANRVGIGHLRMIATIALEETGYEWIEIQGADRTTGANPGRRPRPLRFSRHR